MSFPEQSWPPFSEFSIIALFRILLPAPHKLEHSDHSSQIDHLQSTININFKFLIEWCTLVSISFQTSHSNQYFIDDPTFYWTWQFCPKWKKKLKIVFKVAQNTCTWLIITLLIPCGLPHTVFSAVGWNLNDFPLWFFHSPTTGLRALTPFTEHRPSAINYTKVQQIWLKLTKLRKSSIQ